MIRTFISQRKINLENRPGIVYFAEMLDGGKLYRGLGTNLVVSERDGKTSVSISGDNGDINRKRKLLTDQLNIRLEEEFL